MVTSATLGGSYPSGHVLMVLLLAGCIVLLVWRTPGLSRGRSWASGPVMGWALLVQTAHWLTDVVGAVLMGVVVSGFAPRLRFMRAGRLGTSGPGGRTPGPRSTPR